MTRHCNTGSSAPDANTTIETDCLSVTLAGQAEAQANFADFAKKFAPETKYHIVSSEFLRARETAKIFHDVLIDLGHSVDLAVDSGINEIQLHDAKFNADPRDKMTKVGELNKFLQHSTECDIARETGSEFVGRVTQAVQKYNLHIPSDTIIIFVTHAHAVQVMLNLMEEKAPFADVFIPNATPFEIRV